MSSQVSRSAVVDHLPGGSRGEQSDRGLLTRYHADGDPSAREELVQRYIPLARRLANRYRRDREPIDDLVQVASVGLIKAIDRFDVERGTAFSSYAIPTVLGELKRYFRDVGWAVHVPRDLQERVMQIEQARSSLAGETGHQPTANDIAERLGVSTEDVLEAMEASSAYDAISLDASRRTDDGTGDPISETIGDTELGYETVEYGVDIADTLESLSDRDRMVLHLRFVEDLTQSEIADRVGVSQMHVSRIIRRSLEQLRETVDTEDSEMEGALSDGEV